ncbi:unnamed protein product [Orchesella dallaii]|uniref:Uncharacterized protein n=1 Tax=Orchesella dallaii TaxID=48710 RepID=A0ABP1QYS8_9HEXA
MFPRAFLYSELVYIYDAFNPVVISVVFKAATVKIHTHACYSFNRLEREAYKTRNVWVMKETKVFGNKFYGVYLIGKENDYRHSDFIAFNEPDFGYAPTREILDGASVALIINSTHTNMLCYHLKAINVDGVISGSFVDQPTFCRRADRGQEFDIPWHQSVMTNEAKWGSCGNATFTPNGDDDAENYDNSFEQLNQADFMKPVRNLLENLNESGYLWKEALHGHSFLDRVLHTKFYDKNVIDYIFAVAQLYTNVGGSFNGTVITSKNTTPTLPDYQRYRANFLSKECTVLPTYSSTLIGNCKPNTRNPCSILNHIMTIETVDWKVGKLKAGNWRKDILTTLQRIYARVCPQVAKIFAPAVTRIFEHFLSLTVESDVKAEIKFRESGKDWARVQVNLDYCNSLAKPLPLARVYDDEKLELIRALKNRLVNLTTASRETRRDEEESENRYLQILKIQDELNDMYLLNPYKILLQNVQGNVEELKFHDYVEAAEIDYNLDWAIDSFWKVISTVIGYCFAHYDIPDSGTFIKMYDFFSEEFLDYVKEIWTTQGEDMEVYDQLMGEFVSGSAAIWIDACSSGVYHWRNIPQLKPLRPLYLTLGEDNFMDSGNSSGQRVIPNFFVKNQNF